MNKKLTTCLNCGENLESNYCKKCGQKASTHRFTLQQIVSKDFLIGFLNLEKGFLFTLKSLFTRPGHFIREYIQGKRKTYFHFITFLLIILAVSVFVSQFSSIGLADLVGESDNAKKTMKLLDDFVKKNPRLSILLQIPIFSLASYLFFIKSSQNLGEHLVLNTYKASGEIIINLIFTIITIFYTNTFVLFYIYNLLIYGLLIFFAVFVYYQYFKQYYKNTFKLILRILACILTAQIFLGFFLGFIAIISSIIDGNFK